MDTVGKMSRAELSVNIQVQDAAADEGERGGENKRQHITPEMSLQIINITGTNKLPSMLNKKIEEILRWMGDRVFYQIEMI